MATVAVIFAVVTSMVPGSYNCLQWMKVLNLTMTTDGREECFLS